MSSYLTQSSFNNTIDHGICLPSTFLRQGAWLVIGTIKLVAPMRLRFLDLTVNVIDCNYPVTDVTSLNKIYGNLGLVYVALRQNYTGGDPGIGGALDLVVASETGVTRRAAPELDLSAPGNYTWIVCNNMKPTTDPLAVIPATASIDFDVCVNGMVRMELNPGI